MVVTMVEARVDAARRDELVAAYRELIAGVLPPYLAETFLLGDMASDTWRIVTVRRDRAELERLRASGVPLPAKAMFLGVGAQPALTVFEVAERATSA